MESGIDMIIIVLFFIGMLGIGVYAARKIKDNTDFAIAGRKIKAPLLIGTLVATAIGASSTMGATSLAYEHGIIVMVIIGYTIGLVLFGFIAPIVRRIGVWNLPDVLNLRYGSNMRLVFGCTMILGVVAVLGTQLIAIGLVVQVVLGDLGISYSGAVVGAAVVMVIYTILGGMLAVAYTDFAQSLIMLIAVGVIMPVIILFNVGCATALSWVAPEPGNLLGGLTPMYIIAIFLVDILFCIIDPSLWQRAAASESATSIRKSMFATAGLELYWGMVVVFLGIIASHLYPDLGSSQQGIDSALPRMIMDFLPIGIKGLCIAAMMAIMMSTADTCLLVAGTSFSHDVVSPLMPALNDKSLLMISRLVILLFGIFGTVFALFMSDIFEMMLLAFAIFVASGFAPIMAAIFWKKATKAGAITSSLVGTVLVIVLYGLKLSDMLSSWIDPIIVSTLLAGILMLVVSKLTYNPKTATKRLLDMQNMEA